MAEGIRIDALPTTVAPNLNHVVPAMHEGIAVRLSLAQILALGRVATELADGTDFNTITLNGVFILTSNVNAPVSGGRWLVWSIVDPSDPGSVLHEALLISGGSDASVYTRRSAGGSFGSWIGGIPTADLIPYAGIGFPGAGNVQAAINEAANYTGFVQNETTLQNFVRGLTLSNNGADANNRIDIATGQARGNSVTATNSATLTKRLDASWAVGSGNGGLDTGSKANSTTYHVHAIRRNSDGAFDALFSTSVSAPTMPGGWTRVQRLGSVMTDSSGNIRSFVQNGNDVTLVTSIPDMNGVLANNTPTTIALSVVGGVKVRAKIRCSLHHTAVATVLVTSFDEADRAAALGGEGSITNGVSNGRASGHIEVITNASRQIRIRASTSGGAAVDDFDIVTYGWVDFSVPRIGA